MVSSLQKNVRGYAIIGAGVFGRSFAGLPRTLPHEWLCGLFFVFAWARLSQVAGSSAWEAWVFFSFIAAHLWSMVSLPLSESDSRPRLRLFICTLLMNLTYFVLKSAVPIFHPTVDDVLLQAADRWLVGGNLSLRLEPWIHPAFTEFFSFCYLWYLLYLFSSEAKYLLGDLRLLKKFYGGLFSIYAIGYFGYSTVPALGPCLAMADQFKTPLDGWWLTGLTAAIVRAGSNRVDIFPSLHVANSLYILLFDFRHARRRFWLCLAPCIGLFFSTIYLRYHYFVDVLCGAALSLLALWFADRWERKG